MLRLASSGPVSARPASYRVRIRSRPLDSMSHARYAK